MYKALIADDEAMIRSGIAKLLERDPDIQVVGDAEDGETALELVRQHLPDLLLVDINMPFMNGLEFLEQLGELRTDAVVLVITGYDNFEYVQKALRLGVFDYLLKPIMEESFYEALRKAKQQMGQLQKKSRLLQWARTQLEKNRETLIAYFLKDWLSGRYSEAEIQQQIEELGISVPQCCGLTIVHLNNDEHYPAYEREWDENLIYYAIENIARDICQPLGPLTCGRNSNGDLILLSAREPAPDWSRTEQALHEAIEGALPVKAIVLCQAADTLARIPETYARLMEQLNERQRYTPIVLETQRQIEENYANTDLSLQWAAGRQHISAHYLCRLFRHETGITFIDYVTQVRIRRAVELLLGSELKIYEIAERVGYSSQHYFSSAFKKMLGLSPGEYRKSRQG